MNKEGKSYKEYTSEELPQETKQTNKDRQIILYTAKEINMGEKTI